MTTARAPKTARAIVDDVLGRDMTREIWTANYEKALPISVQDFDLFAVLPAVFYMFRFGHRRGKGSFLDTFASSDGSAKERRQAATIERVATRLAKDGLFEGFDAETERAILGDLLLCFCLENSKRSLGRDQQVQRVAPAHYMAAWIDLPEHVSNLRHVPEMIVAMLSDQPGEYIQQNREGDKTWFYVGKGFERNVLLRAFLQGVSVDGELGSRTSDHFEEKEPVGLDQLLMIRLAQTLRAAPDKLRGSEGERIPNQRPIAKQASRYFSEDIRSFIRSYSELIPRHAFVELLESCVSVGMTTILTSVIEILFEWAETGRIKKAQEQKPTPLFVDCSNGVDRRLRALAEQSLDDFVRRIEHLPVILMVLRLLDRQARYDPTIKRLTIRKRPYANEWLEILGDLLYERRQEAAPILYDLARKAAELAERLETDYPECAAILRNEVSLPNVVWRFAEALTLLQGRKNTQSNVVSLIDSSLLVGRPNGLAMKRTVTRNVAVTGTRRRSEARSLVLSDSVLDYLVHRHVLKAAKKPGLRALSYRSFIQILRDRHGFCIDTSPPGITISNDLLMSNRATLERRLRDLGLLIGVNDAEAMKRLQPRFDDSKEDEHGME